LSELENPNHDFGGESRDIAGLLGGFFGEDRGFIDRYGRPVEAAIRFPGDRAVVIRHFIRFVRQIERVFETHHCIVVSRVGFLGGMVDGAVGGRGDLDVVQHVYIANHPGGKGNTRLVKVE